MSHRLWQRLGAAKPGTFVFITLAATVLGLILRSLFDGQAIGALVLGAASFVLAAISALLVKEHRA